MNLNAAAGLKGMLKDGFKTYEGLYGAVFRNIEAAKAISAMVRTSLGPNGMNKLVVNHLEKIIVTSDCAAIMNELEVQHPAAKLLVLAAQMQDNEFGDQTNFVVSFAGELLKLAEDLLRNGLHTAEVIAGYQRAYTKVLEILPTLVVRTVDNPRDLEQLKTSIRSVLATKQFGYEDALSDLVVEACLTTLSPSAKVPKLNIDSVRIAKLKGGSLDHSSVIKGMVILRDAEGLIKRAENAKVAVYGCGLEAAATEAKGTVLLKSAEELLNYNKSEERKMEELIEGIASTGVKVVIANGSISEMAQHFLDKFEIMVVKIQSKFDLRRICGAVGATAAVRLGPLTPEEIGECSLVEVREIGGRKVTVFNQVLDEDTTVATIVVRASTENVLNDVERALDDGIHSVKTIFHDNRLLAGAGAVELELAKQLKAYAELDKGLDQYAMRKFAEAFEVVPRTLAENSGADATSTLHALNTAHAAADGQHIGFNVESSTPFNAADAGVYDLYATKFNALRLAVDAAITVLKVDQIVMSKPAGGPKPRSGAQDPDM
jgi:T-complex protein 1 subunit theta